jgi:hypothetical protein
VTIVVTQINYPNLNKQDSIEQARDRSQGRFSLDFYAMRQPIERDWDCLGYNRIKQSS